MDIKKFDLKEWASSFHWTKDRLVLLAGLAAAVLLLISTFSSQKEKAVDTKKTITTEEYTQQLEKRLTDTLGQVKGVGKVSVMVTLENGWEAVYAQEEKTGAQTTGDSDNRTSQNSYQNEYVIYDSQSGKQPLVTTNKEPEVKGVVVVCEGGDSVTVINSVTEVVRVVLGVPSNRVCVTKLT